MLSTRNKSPLPKGLSYPLGAQLLSSLLGELRIGEQLSLHFSAGYSSNARHRLLEMISAHNEVAVVSFVYSHIVPDRAASAALIESGYFAQRWEIHVSAVPSEFKNSIRERFIAEGVLRACAWLDARAESWRHGRKALKFTVLLPEVVLRAEEENLLS